jgi:hypothetical protein
MQSEGSWFPTILVKKFKTLSQWEKLGMVASTCHSSNSQKFKIGLVQASLGKK